MKIIFLLLLLPFTGQSQDTSKVVLPMKGRIIFYTRSVDHGTGPQKERINVFDLPSYQIRFTTSVVVIADTTIISAYDFYEKPNYPGVTNDFSKIEYRWRDFVKGKPWRPDDEALFKELDRKVREFLASFPGKK